MEMIYPSNVLGWETPVQNDCVDKLEAALVDRPP